MDTSSESIKSRDFKHDVPTFSNVPVAFHGVRFDVHTLHVPGQNHQTVRRDVVVHPGAVLILPILDEDHIVLIHNQRFAVGKTLWELPAGTLEPGESPAKTATRELTEETGYVADSIQELSYFYTTPGFCNEIMYCYVARGLTLTQQSLDENERITVKTFHWKKVLLMIRQGEIVDGKTIAALLYYHTFSR